MAGCHKSIYGNTTPPLFLSQPSFDCKKAQGQVEKTICRAPHLAQLDLHLQQVFQQATYQAKQLDNGKDAAITHLKNTQRGWIKGRNDCWKETNLALCVENSYQQRIAFLRATWQLSSPTKVQTFFCPDSKAEFVVNYFQQPPLPSVAIEYGDKRKVFTFIPSPSPASKGQTYQGEFGSSFTQVHQQGALLWEQNQTTITCPAAPFPKT